MNPEDLPLPPDPDPEFDLKFRASVAQLSKEPLEYN